jgi:hypothetical protein
LQKQGGRAISEQLSLPPLKLGVLLVMLVVLKISNGQPTTWKPTLAHSRIRLVPSLL